MVWAVRPFDPVSLLQSAAGLEASGRSGFGIGLEAPIPARSAKRVAVARPVHGTFGGPVSCRCCALLVPTATHAQVDGTMALQRLALLTLFMGGACVVPESRSLGPAPRYVPLEASFSAQDLDRDVVVCAERARESVAAGFEGWWIPTAVARQRLRERTSQCMEWKGWREEGRDEAQGG